ncbi:flagellar filament capping protein FliD [Lutispora saccharofermentans]|uniref:Flagellar hook-associated protein 2 n=1 Tax=Lutispora saccharofermentans TaxID=3024236 RepID=A0ABT1NDA8_9FIRM|nr:flagellar filament capping protein FliD [Lutispora saccharofermentans]MCQ1528619.1 flagellar filament capping protein FliD [Lutispora saccharofermentans]
MVNNISGMLNSKLRFTGMASGLDTDSIIQQMMRVERMKVDKVKQDKQLLEWKRDDYRSFSSILKGFKDEFFETTRPASNMRFSNTYYAYKSKYSVEGVVTASANSQVSMMEHTIDVVQLAKTARLEAEAGKLGANSLSTSSSMEDVANKFGGLTLADGKYSLEINGETITVGADKKFSDLISAINNSKADVKISYSPFLDQFFMESKGTGTNAKIDLTQSAAFFQELGFAASIATEVKTGENAKFFLDGKIEGTDGGNNPIPTERDSNIFTIDGVTYTLTGTGETKITLAQDTDAIFDKIKNFIDKYNEIVNKITAKINETRPKSGGRYGSYYLPLTDEQKDAMDEDEIEKWEESAKKGLVRNDGLLNNVLYSLRRAMGDNTEAGTLASIGISTGEWREGARLNIDEEKLKKAIADNPDKVMNIFAKQPEKRYDPDATAAERKERYDGSGVIERLFDVLEDNIRTTRDKDGKKGLLLEKAGIIGDLTEFESTMVKQIGDKEKLIYDLTEKLYDKENALYMKFAALETALSRMNSQSAWLSQSLGGN